MTSSKRALRVALERLPLAKPFRISGHTFTETPVAVVTISDGDHVGRGEAAGVYYLDDNIDRVTSSIEALRPRIEAGLSRIELQDALPAGGARNAMDCALWELESQQVNRPVWALAGLLEVRPLVTAFTLGADSPEMMRDAAAAYDIATALKLKLSGDIHVDIERVKLVRAARPDCWIGVDANQGFSIDALRTILPTLVGADVALIEQPLPRGQEEELRGFDSPIPLAADESVQTRAELQKLVGLFDMINIKLDKCGGLTEALAMAAEARTLGFDVMVGNMTGSSLAMAPSFVLGQLCNVVDLDGPTFLTRDRDPAVTFADGKIWCPETVWGRDAQPAHA